MVLNTTTEAGKRIEQRLRDEWIIWLTTVDRDGTPQPRPVWFVWDGASFLIYSRPTGYKLKHIERNARVSLNLDGDGKGGDIVVFTGTARIDDSAPRLDQNDAYVSKYGMVIVERLKSSVEAMARGYSMAIRVTPDAVRGD